VRGGRSGRRPPGGASERRFGVAFRFVDPTHWARRSPAARRNDHDHDHDAESPAAGVASLAGGLGHVVPVAPGAVRRLVSALRGVHQGDVSSYGSPRVVQGHRLAAVLQDPGRRLVDHGLPEAGSAISGYGTRHRHLVTHSHTTISSLLQEHGLSPSRALGQNFVTDPNTVRRIARLADVGPNDFVLEIGPGLGSLTLALVETGATVEAIEVDRYLLPALRSVVDAH